MANFVLAGILNAILLAGILLLSAILSFAAPVSSAPLSIPKEVVPVAPCANTRYTPLSLPADTAVSGLSLSGQAKLIRTEKQHYQLDSGCILLHAEEPILINTSKASVAAAEGSSIVVSVHNQVVRVLNLTDRKRNSVRVVFAKNFVPLNPGEEIAIVCANAPDVEKAAAEYVIRYRNAQVLSVSPELKAVLFEFSLLDAMRHCSIFKQLRESPDKNDQELLAEIIKTAAALNTMFATTRAPYTHGGVQPAVAKNQNGAKLAKRMLTVSVALGK